MKVVGAGAYSWLVVDELTLKLLGFIAKLVACYSTKVIPGASSGKVKLPNSGVIRCSYAPTCSNSIKHP